MPTYDYKCSACSHEFEQFQSMKDKALRKCPKCGKPALERLIGTGGAVIFKGGGFYQTDYRTESYKKGAESDSKPTPTESAKPDAPPMTQSAPEKKAVPDATTPPKPKADKASAAKPKQK